MAKCSLCNKVIEDSQSVILYKNRKVHKQCFDHIMGNYVHIERSFTKQKEDEKKQARKELKEKIKPVEDIKEGLSEEEYQFKKSYYAYLRNALGLLNLPSKYYVITDKQMEKYDYTYSGMYQTLIYIHDIIQKEFDADKNIVLLIPYYYEEADIYYADLKRLEEHNKGKNINNMYQKRTIKVIKDKNNKNKTWDF